MPFAHILRAGGMLVPEPVLTNRDLAKLIDTMMNGFMIILELESHIARENEFPSTLAVEAAPKALAVANLALTELDLIIYRLPRL
ncbi:MAG: hypothetical protein IPJ46_21605 [Anaerolineales bacterium]|nr:hypothetical protein [Anaerolineales bacterium]